MLTRESIEQVVGAPALSRDGRQVGTVTQVYLDDHDRPAWIALDTHLFASAEVYLPADGARLDEQGRLQVMVTAEQVDTAPRIDLEAVLTPADQQRLRAHYRPPTNEPR